MGLGALSVWVINHLQDFSGSQAALDWGARCPGTARKRRGPSDLGARARVDSRGKLGLSGAEAQSHTYVHAWMCTPLITLYNKALLCWVIVCLHVCN